MRTGILRLIGRLLGYPIDDRPLTLRHLAGWNVRPATEIGLSWSQYLLQRPLIFGLWYQWRRTKFLLSRKPLRLHQFSSPEKHQHLVDMVVPYSKDRMWKVSRRRTESLMNILRSVPGVTAATCKLLCIGPRNEGELLLMATYGFALQNIRAIDLISYSPLIEPMDMHDLKFDDNTFDITYIAYTLPYSDDAERVRSEIVRVTRNGGLIVVAFTKSGETGSEVVGTSMNSLEDLLALFDHHCDNVFWQFDLGKPRGVVSAIFSIRKPETERLGINC